MKYKRLWIIVALSLLMIFALVRLGNINMSWDTLARVNLGWYSLVAVSYYASLVARGWRWQGILKTMGWSVSFVYATTLLTAGLFLSAILPARAGDIGRVAMLKQDHNIPVAKAVASIAGERALDVFAILIMALVSGWLALPGQMPPQVLQLVAVVTGLFVAGLVALLVVPGIEAWLRENRLLKKAAPAKIWALYQTLLDFGFSLLAGVRMLGQKPARLLVAISQSFFIWIWDALMIYFILISLDIVAPFSVSLFSAMISDLVTAVPLTPGALGQFDAALVSLLALFGISTSNGSLTVLLLRFVQLWTFIPISGFITYIFGFSRALNLSQTEATAAPTALSSTPAEG